MRTLITWIWMRQNEGLPTKILLFPLFLLSLIVSAAARFRRMSAPKKAFHAPIPVISVGNLVVGGVGKTPVAIELALRLTGRLGKKVVILSRGYGRKGKDGEIAPLVVSDGKNILTSAEEGGDEPVLMARALPSVPILVGPDRAVLAQKAIKEFSPDVRLMDDGFQHFKLARDLDVVVTDGADEVEIPGVVHHDGAGDGAVMVRKGKRPLGVL